MKAYGYVKGAQQVIDLWPIGAGMWLEINAAQAYERMVDAAAKEGITFHVNSAFRDAQKQDMLYRKYVKEMAEWERNKRLGPRPVGAFPASRSKHTAGEALDINGTGTDAPALEWLHRHANEYGFYFPYDAEPWHAEYHPERLTQTPPKVA